MAEQVAFAIYRNFVRHDPRAHDRWARLPALARARWLADAEAAIAEVVKFYGPVPPVAA